MARIGRNQPCPCGSGRKAKRCCGVPRGPAPDDLARIFLDKQADYWLPVVADLPREEVADVFEEVSCLPHTDLTLHLPLPRLLPPALDGLREALAGVDEDRVEEFLPQALALVDTPVVRERLARAVLALHDDGHRVGCEVTALALYDLAHSEPSVLLTCALLWTLMVRAGVARTPSGLLVGDPVPAMA